MSGKDAAMYMVFQVIGAVIGSAILYALVSTGAHGGPTATGSNGFADGMMLQAFIAEAVFTFIFVLVVLGSTDSEKGAGNLAGLAIGLTLVLVHIVCIPVTGTSVNPARSIGPALDNDEYRRGRRTTHIVYGEAMAILAGDALLNYAYETTVRAFEIEPGNPAIGKALQILTKKTGIYGMLGGQCVDVEAAGREISREKLDFIYRLKTSALIEASMMVGAALAGASEAEIKVIEDSARDIGLAFQIRDDILDVTSTTDELGKPVFSDEKNDKTTYVTIEGIEKAKSDVDFKTCSFCLTVA